MWNMYIYSSAHKLYKHYGVNMFTYSYPSSCLGSHKERCGGNHKLEREIHCQRVHQSKRFYRTAIFRLQFLFKSEGYMYIVAFWLYIYIKFFRLILVCLTSLVPMNSLATCGFMPTHIHVRIMGRHATSLA